MTGITLCSNTETRLRAIFQQYDVLLPTWHCRGLQQQVIFRHPRTHVVRDTLVQTLTGSGSPCHPHPVTLFQNVFQIEVQNVEYLVVVVRQKVPSTSFMSPSANNTRRRKAKNPGYLSKPCSKILHSVLRIFSQFSRLNHCVKVFVDFMTVSSSLLAVSSVAIVRQYQQRDNETRIVSVL